MNITAIPSLKRRLASMVYEAMLLFGVLFISGWLFSTLLQQRHALYLRDALQDWLFLVIGLYFVWFWTHSGQTLAMKTWRIRLETRDGSAVGTKRAIGRYLLSWLWVLPGLALAWALGLKGWLLILIPSVNILLWALAAYLDPQRQFLHDRIAGTRIVSVPESSTKPGAKPS
ncbi:RDD family protein [Noviherbaspirillum cavernae]|uniref:RDD family protein n=1 Tax=Noviherbaspirillum cavernae TaxID=2320862 RepID=UPI003BF4EC05